MPDSWLAVEVARRAANLDCAHGTYGELRLVVPLADVQAFVDFARRKFGRVDVLFNNAGVMLLAPILALKTDEWSNMIDTNIRGVLHGIAAVLPLMTAQGSGHIINTASTAARAVGPACAVYCASKYAVRAITEGLRQEPDQIRATLISPGVTTTELGDTISDQGSAAFVKELRRASLTPDALARAVLYAISQPEDVDVSEIIVRPVRTAGHAFQKKLREVNPGSEDSPQAGHTRTMLVGFQPGRCSCFSIP